MIFEVDVWFSASKSVPPALNAVCAALAVDKVTALLLVITSVSLPPLPTLIEPPVPIKNKNKVVIMYPIPFVNIGRRGLAKGVMVRGKLLDKLVERAEYESITKRSFEFYDSLDFHTVKRIYSHRFLCEGNLCYGVKDSHILISDIDHPSIETAKWISEEIVTDGFW